MLAPSRAIYPHRPCSTSLLRLTSRFRKARRTVVVNSVSLDSVEDSINDVIDKTETAYEATIKVVTDVSEKIAPAVSAFQSFVEANSPTLKKGVDLEK